MPKFVIKLSLSIIIAAIITFVSTYFKNSSSTNITFAIGFLVVILGLGIFALLKIAGIIEETTTVLKDKVGLAGGLLQAIGTAFPDMIIGIVAAISAVNATNDEDKLKFAILAAAATFGSNIYNVGHAAWCVWRQNRANELNKEIKMFITFGEDIKPMDQHDAVPRLGEIDNATTLLSALSVLTFLASILMVVVGKQPMGKFGFEGGDLYQLNAAAGVLLILAAIGTIWKFRKNTSHSHEEEDNEFQKINSIWSFVCLAISAVAIYFTANAMVGAVEHFTEVAHFPIFIAGLLAGLIGCLGEIIVVHNFSVNPKGKIGDALVGVGMDNIMTLIGASIVAIMGGIFLGGSEVIVIFCGVLFLNTILILQIGKLKNHYVDEKHKIS
jgi:Ca2+/Na+ antiporter